MMLAICQKRQRYHFCSLQQQPAAASIQFAHTPYTNCINLLSKSCAPAAVLWPLIHCCIGGQHAHAASPSVTIWPIEPHLYNARTASPSTLGSTTQLMASGSTPARLSRFTQFSSSSLLGTEPRLSMGVG